MPCDSIRNPRQTPKQREVETKSAVQKLNAALGAGSVTVKVGPQGAISFVGWSNQDRLGVTDACAYRKLVASGSPEFRRALARAEVTAGRKADPRAISSGTHSHDGGKTWYPGH